MGVGHHSFLCQEQKTAKALYSERLSPQDSGKPKVVASLDPGLIEPAALKTLTLVNRRSELVLE